jgi:predicted alpha-1,2-mannosidase
MKFSGLLILAVLNFQSVVASAKTKDHTQLVNVFVGTDAHGHTFPGATLPHGMVQLSPDTRTETWDGCAGYHYSDRSIMGFSHIHYSGVGSGGGADILLMPGTGQIKLTAPQSADDVSGYRASFKHENETASPGYYAVRLDNGIMVELTATLRTGLHKYSYPETDKGNIILDLTHGINDNNDSLYVKKLSATKIQGFRQSSGGLDGNRRIYFVAEFSQPVVNYGFYIKDKLVAGATGAGGKNVKAHFTFDTKKIKEVLVKVAISRVDFEGAAKNLKAELPDWNFNVVKEKARKLWEVELGRISIEGGTEGQQRTFYTAMYHTFVHPNINFDIDRRYRSTDHKVYTATGFDNYTTFSLWDTFRALHPLYTIIEPKRTNQFIRSFIEKYQHFGSLPIMEFGGNEGFAMIGYHSLPVIADAWSKGIRDYDVKTAYEGMKKLSEGFRDGKEVYKKIGFIPYDAESQSVARTLEYCYDDWCVSRLAKVYSKADYDYYSQKGAFYKNLFDTQTGFMRPRGSDYHWLTPFDPIVESGHYTEANAYQYTTFVPQDINGLIKLMGGDEKFDRWLDVCFSLKNSPSSANLQDMTGLIGQYAHGNEPSHDMAYLYSFIGKSWKSQQKARQIVDDFYTDQPNGLCGNDDAGQMSAWYILTAMGFYPTTPGVEGYVIGSPVFDKVSLHLENGKQFILRAKNGGPRNIYVQSLQLNGKDHPKSYFKHQDIVNGGEMVFEMGENPNEQWGSNPENRPRTPDYPSPVMPRIESKEKSFLQSTEIVLSCDTKEAAIHYTLDGSDPSESLPVYSGKFILDHSATLKARSFIKGENPGYATSVEFEKLTPAPATEVKNPQPGLHFEYLEGYCVKVEDMKKYAVISSGIISTFNISAITDKRSFGYTFQGYLDAPESGVYTIYLNSNDGGILSIDGKVVIDNDGFHRTQEKSKRLALAKGYHPILLKYFQMGGVKALNVSWEKPGNAKEEIPAGALWR